MIMSKYLRVMGLCFSLSIFLALAGFISTVAEENDCDGLEGRAYGLCKAYCEVMDCDSDEHKAPESACNKILTRYITETQSVPPCIDTCADLAAENPCPCPFFQVPFDCWMGNPNTFHRCRNTTCTAPDVTTFDGCDLQDPMASVPRWRLLVENEIGVLACSAHFDTSDPPCGLNIEVGPLTLPQFATCLCDIALYTTIAHQAGVEIDPDQEDYSCEPPD